MHAAIIGAGKRCDKLRDPFRDGWPGVQVGFVASCGESVVWEEEPAMSQRLDSKRGRRTAQPLGSSPDYRWNAVPSTERVSVVAEEASWEPGTGTGARGSEACARLAVTVRVREAPQFTRVWVDVYAFGPGGALLTFDTHDLQYAEPAGDGGDLFSLDAPVWGPGLTPWSSPPAVPRTLKYRVYVRPDAGLFTDGLLHEVPLPERNARRGRQQVERIRPRSEAQA
jgi:hypothetical protein